MANVSRERPPSGEPLSSAPRTHDKCAREGLYISTCGCEDRVTMTESTYFPSCIKCRKEVTWLLQKQP